MVTLTGLVEKQPSLELIGLLKCQGTVNRFASLLILDSKLILTDCYYVVLICPCGTIWQKADFINSV